MTMPGAGVGVGVGGGGGRQGLNHDFRMLCEIGCRFSTGVNRGPIPNQDKALGQVTTNMFQCDNDLLTLHALGEMLFVQLPRQREAHCRGNAATLFLNAPQDRTFAFRCPRAPQRFLERKSELIEKDYIYAASPRFFLYAANLGATTPQSVPRHVRARGAAALAGSNPTFGAGDSNS
jgi:hypothetical protein